MNSPNRHNSRSRPGYSRRMRLMSGILLMAILSGTLSGCVYFNTFYNAKKNFNEAEKTRLESMKTSVFPRISKGKYRIAIEKSSIILEKHPDSKYYDDALYIIGVSYYWLKDYLRSQRKFREILVNFEDSKYVVRSKLYLAQCKFNLDERAEAITIFQSLLETVEDKGILAEAAFAIGDFYFEQEEYHNAEPYYQGLIDSLANNEDERRRATLRIADGRFSRFDIAGAKQSYSSALKMKPTEAEEFRARFRIGECSYLLLDVSGGLELFQEMAADENFYDSIGVIRLQVAKGYELDDDLILAVEEYKELSYEVARTGPAGQALYNLGLIYQFDYEDLEQALDYYGQTKSARRSGNPYYDDAVKRAADITKLAEYRQANMLDSAATTDQIDDASLAQLQLGELYLLDLNLPDSALDAFRYAIDSFSTAYYTPRALLSLALTHRDYFDDTTSFDTLMERFVAEYHRSDFYPAGLEALGLTGTAADTGHPASYFEQAERWLVEEGDIDSALSYYRLVADSFPESRIAPLARFTTIWLEDQYFNPGDDSAIFFAYSDLAADFPDDDYGKLAGRIVNYRPPDPPTEEEESFQVEEEETIDADSVSADTSSSAFPEAAGIFTEQELMLNPELRFYVGPDRQQLRDAPGNPAPLKVIDFIYPTSAASQPDQFDMYFQVRIDFDGSVRDYELMNPTQFQDLNEAISEQIANFIFNTAKFGDEGIGDGWFLHKYRVVKPEYLR